MNFTMLLKLLENIAGIAVISLVIGQLNYFRNVIYGKNDWKRMIILSVLFGFLSVIGTEHGIRVNDALANTRIVGAVVGGLIGGPFVGAFAGIIGGIHRYSIGGFTAVACAVSTVLTGLLGGFVGVKYNILRMKWHYILLLGIVAELIQKVLVLLIAKPFAAALTLELQIAVPTTIVTVLGLAIFIIIFQNLKVMQDQSGALVANLALTIASRTLPHLRTGLNERSAEKTVEIIHEIAMIDAIAITDCEKTLSMKGPGLARHLAGEQRRMHVAKTVLAQTDVIYQDNENLFPRALPLRSVIGAPLYNQDRPVGTLQFYAKSASFKMSQTNLKLVDGLAKLLSVQIELAEIEHQTKMRQQAELNALQAQINPHFLFNTLGTIKSYCRTDPELARSLIGNLSDIFRRNLKHKGSFTSLQEELDGIMAYLEIEKVRFANRLTVCLEIDDSLPTIQLPVLTLQPLIENAIHHGLFPKISDCVLTIRVNSSGSTIKISIADNGVGMSEERLAEIRQNKTQGIGLSNVHQRLQTIYGSEYGLAIESKPGVGTTVTFDAPATEPGKEVTPLVLENNHH